MFDRVSTAPIPESFLRSYWGGGGVYLGKKFTDVYGGEADGGEYPPVLNGWVDWDYSKRRRTYPEYEMPTDLPPWVVDPDKKRYLIGADSLVGPLSFTEAVYLRSVVKKIKSEAEPITFTCSTNGASATVSSSEGSFIDEDYLDEIIDTSYPLNLFSHEFKAYQFWQSYDADGTPPISTAVGSAASCSLSVSMLPFSGSTYSIVMDVDDYSKYYVEIPPYVYSAIAYFGTAETKEEVTEKPADPPRTVSASDGGLKTCTLVVGRRKFLARIDTLTEVLTKSLSSAGDSLSATWGAATEFRRTLTYISGSLEFTFKGVTRTIELSGIEFVEHTNTSFGFEQGRMPYSNLNSIAPNSPLKSTAVGFWPYKNADSLPVYSTSTGEITNDPIP